MQAAAVEIDACDVEPLRVNEPSVQSLSQYVARSAEHAPVYCSSTRHSSTVPKSQSRMAETKSRILDAAARAFASRGFHRATVRQIAADARSMKSLYFGISLRRLTCIGPRLTVRYGLRTDPPGRARRCSRRECAQSGALDLVVCLPLASGGQGSSSASAFYISRIR